MSCVCGQKKDQLATPFQRCLHGEKAVVVVVVEVAEVELPSSSAWRYSCCEGVRCGTVRDDA